ncbi:hypothetical protein BT63DRAFT_3413 [Microthyrium microscopicum]|uniref:Uncharacterized protein n=1 Tax=Microthyrium microscopicum TaxID=703497 RepID=A0A6A6URY5_9PEZI|nr:hypothetical protein BT63DRAFT_3413 [Microthyrium microscopicum]
MPTSQSFLFTAPIFSLLLLLVAGESPPPPNADPSVIKAYCDPLRFHHTGFWDIDIDNWPVLPVVCGPPAAANSDRNIAHLPYQIAGILASYVVCAIGVGTGIVTIRRKRKKLLIPPPVELKLVANESRKFELSPTSPASSLTSWMRNPLRKKGQSAVSFTSGPPDGSALNSPAGESMFSFDANIVDGDRMSRQAEMERLYAAVMVHDAARRSQLSQLGQNQFKDSASVQNMPRASVASTVASRPADKRLQRVTGLEIRAPMSPSYDQTPKSPIRAIYPPDHDIPEMPQSPTSPIRATVPDDFWPQAGKKPLKINSSASLRVPAPPMSATMPLSPTTPKIELPNDMYPASPPPGQRRMRLPNQPFTPLPGQTVPITPISPGPMSSAMYGTLGPAPKRVELQNDMYPASPGLPPGAQYMTLPPPPGTSSSKSDSLSSKTSKGRKMLKNMRINTGAQDEQDREERTPLSPVAQTANRDEAVTPDTPEDAHAEDKFEGMNSILPQPAPSRLGTPGRRPPNLNLSGPTHKPSISSIGSSNTVTGLPASPAPSHRSTMGLPGSNVRPMSSAQTPRLSPPPTSSHSTAAAPGGSKPLPFRAFQDSSSLLSPGPVKTTFLDRKVKPLRGPMTAKTPMTGVPQTPYSAYMPFTPMTPITPRLVTRKERKDRKKQMGKTLMDDAELVKEEDEDWS